MAHFRIAVVEDNPPDLLVIQRSIRDTGLDCEFTAFADGEEAIAFLSETDSQVPDLMILDFNTPRKDGPSVLNSLRSNPRWSEVAVFMFTASQEPGNMARAAALGVDRYLIKPMNLDGFLKFGKEVQEWLEKRRSAASEE